MKLKHLENIDKRCVETDCIECPLNEINLCPDDMHETQTFREIIEKIKSIELPERK